MVQTRRSSKLQLAELTFAQDESKEAQRANRFQVLLPIYGPVVVSRY